MSSTHEKLMQTLTAQAIDAADPPQDGVPRVLVFTDGKPMLVPVESILPEPVEGEELEATPETLTPAPGVEALLRYNVAPAYEVDMGAASSHWIYAGEPYEMTFKSAAGDAVEHSVRVAIRGPAAGTFPQITEWHTPPPKADETGRLTVSVLYWRGKPIWGGWWSPVVGQ